jgi:hypothetical protein
LRPDYLTNRADNGDLSRAVANTMGINPGGRPLLLVIKKNPSVLRNLLFWIERISNGRDPATNRHVLVNVPLLLIDDEADNASVDTGHQEFDETGTPDLEHDPKTINGLIRQVLLSFEQSAFLGYTATPFANIYIHDKGRTTEEGEDLFPRSFIMNLPAPSNYDGPVRIFGLDPQDDDIESGRGLPLVRQVTDHAISASLTGSRPCTKTVGHLFTKVRMSSPLRSMKPFGPSYWSAPFEQQEARPLHTTRCWFTSRDLPRSRLPSNGRSRLHLLE